MAFGVFQIEAFKDEDEIGKSKRLLLLPEGIQVEAARFQALVEQAESAPVTVESIDLVSALVEKAGQMA